MSVIEIRNVISALTEKDRAELAAWILDSLTEHGDEDALAESIAEADRRREDLESGRSSLLSESEFWSRVERKR
jgi:putative addiction module component (TIGR02574 family)